MSRVFTTVTSIVLALSLIVGCVAFSSLAFAEPSEDVIASTTANSSSTGSKTLSPAAQSAVEAKELGEKMATLQNQYQGAVASSDAFQKTVSDISALLDDNNQTQRVPWYSEKGKWVLAGVAHSKGGDTIVLWRCEGPETKNDKMPILAFAHATYKDGKFTNVSHTSTQQGTASVSATGQQDGLADMVEDIRSKTEGMDTTNNISDEDYAGIANAREQLKNSQK